MSKYLPDNHAIFALSWTVTKETLSQAVSMHIMFRDIIILVRDN